MDSKLMYNDACYCKSIPAWCQVDFMRGSLSLYCSLGEEEIEKHDLITLHLFHALLWNVFSAKCA